jgi:signal transduction histidine kinase
MSNPLAGVRGRVTFAVLAVAAVVFSVLGTVGFLQIAHSGRNNIEDRVSAVLDDLESAIRNNTGTVDISTPDGVTAVAMQTTEQPTPAGAGEIVITRTIQVNGSQLLLVGRSSEARLTESLRSLFRGLWVAIPLAAVISALLAGIATQRALRPVADITQLAATIGATADGARVPVPDTADEVQQLAVTVNEMLDRIDHGRSVQRQFTSDAAHELRTPLMALQGELELVHGRPDAVDEETLVRLESLSRRLGDRIDDLVLLSTLDESRPLVLAPVSLLDLARDEAIGMASSATVDGDDVTVPVDRALAARAVRNLLSNAKRHARERVAVRVVDGHDRVWLHVDDDGPGTSADQRATMFVRFARLDEARTVDRGGAGLGLAIVASVAEAHHGGASAQDSPLGGARLSIWFPKQPIS